MAKMANGLASDLATAVLLATDKPVLVAPAMNPRMWAHPATRRNRATLEADGIRFAGPARGEMAETGEAGEGRMAEPLEIVAAVETMLAPPERPLAGQRIIVTSGPTHEPIDPVRYIANRSSGRQGHAIAAALAALGADVHLVSGPVAIEDPAGVSVTHVETARQMAAAVQKMLPADAAVMVAAVADWRAETEAGGKIKKENGKAAPELKLRRPSCRTPAPRRRIRRGDRRYRRERQGQAPAQACRFHRGKRRFGRKRCHGRRAQPRCDRLR
jgi:phosphopantothenoylcysteine decarboxylase/phosphopantothenate--cysteine ligase